MAVTTSDYSLTASPGRALPVAVHAEGCRIRDADGPRVPRRLRRGDGDEPRPPPPAARGGAQAPGRRADLHVPLLLRQRAHDRPRRPDPRHRPDGARVGLLQLLGLRVRGVGHPHGDPLLAAPRPAVEDRADLPLPELPRLDPRAPWACPARRGARRSSSCWRRTRSRRRRTPTSAPGARRSRRSSSPSRRSRTPSRRAAPTTSRPSSWSPSPAPAAPRSCRPDGYFERCARCATATRCC